MALLQKFLKYVRRNTDPSQRPEAVDISVSDYAPTTGGMFRALNASVAGQITIYRADGTLVPVYVNTGWNAQAGWKIKHGGSGDTATILAAELDE